MRIYTIGHGNRLASELVALLKENAIQVLVDIRLKPGGQLSGFAKGADLAYFVPRLVPGCRYLRQEIADPLQIAHQVTQDLEQRQVYLRIGLARGWAKFPERCFLQITGIYTFPDYLHGKTFADFSLNETRSWISS